jgi:hypothetical protein
LFTIWAPGVRNAGLPDGRAGLDPGLPDFSWSKHTKLRKNIPNDCKLF